MSEVNGEIETFALPSMDPEIVFTYKKPKRTTNNGLVVITFNIVMVKIEPFIVYAFISIPDNSFNGFLFSNGQIVQQIAINPSNTTMFLIEESMEIMKGVFENVSTKPINACINELLKKEKLQNLHKVCNTTQEMLLHDEIFPLGKDKAIVIKAKIDNKETQINCDKETEHFWTGAAIIFFPDCTLVNNKVLQSPTIQKSITLETINNKHQEESLHPVDIIVENLTEDPRIKQLHDEIKEVLSDEFFEDKGKSGKIIFSTIMAIIMIIILAAWYIKNKQPGRQPNTLPAIQYINQPNIHIMDQHKMKQTAEIDETPNNKKIAQPIIQIELENW